MRFTPRHLSAGPLVAVAAWLATSTAAPAYDLHFDYTSFENSPGKHFQQAQFNVLNYPSINGNYMMTSTDNHRPEMVANGNALAQFYSPFCCATGSDYLDNPRPTAIQEADSDQRLHDQQFDQQWRAAGLADSQRDIPQPVATKPRRSQPQCIPHLGDR